MAVETGKLLKPVKLKAAVMFHFLRVLKPTTDCNFNSIRHGPLQKERRHCQKRYKPRVSLGILKRMAVSFEE